MAISLSSFSQYLPPLDSSTALIVSGTAAITLLAVQLLKVARLSEEELRDGVARSLLKVHYIRKHYEYGLQIQFSCFSERTLKTWRDLDLSILQIPEEPWSDLQISQLLDDYAKKSASDLEELPLSGILPACSSVKAAQKERLTAHSSSLPLPQDQLLCDRLTPFFQKTFEISGLWNSLHFDDFPLGSSLEYQVTHMVASMFGGTPDKVAGLVTSGGTESLMHAMLSYRNWGVREKDIPSDQTVIIAPDTVDPAVEKAAKDYQMKLIRVATDIHGRVDMEQLKQAVEYYRYRLVVIVGSAPSYGTGEVDPVAEFGVLGTEYVVGVHVDCSLGAFLLNYLPGYDTCFLAQPGITSLSADAHKNGCAPQKLSTLLMKRMPRGKNLAFYGSYAFPRWQGGIYGSVSTDASRFCQPALMALIAMLSIGQTGYRQIAEEIHETVNKVRQGLVQRFSTKIELLGEHTTPLVAFGLHNPLRLGKGAIDALADELKQRRFIVTRISQDGLHLWVSRRFVLNKLAVEQFLQAVDDSLQVIEKELKPSIPSDQETTLSQRLNCAIDTSFREGNRCQAIWNFFLGSLTAKDMLGEYLLAQLTTA